MARRADDLPIELWIHIFDYLSIHDIFQSFSNLNKYFNDLLVSAHFLFKLELKNDDNIEHLGSFYTSDTILNRIISLKSCSYDHFPEFFQVHGGKLIRLRSLFIKANTREIPSIGLALQQLNKLEYLSLSCIPNQNLLENILTSPSLRQCRLHFWRVINPIHDYLNANSDIETLYIQLNDNANHSILNFLLSHMPKLKKLRVFEENLINDNSHPLFNQNLSSLEILNLRWGFQQIHSDCLRCLSTTMPNLKHLSLTIFYKTLNENLIDQLWLILKDMKQLKLSILFRRLTKSIETNSSSIFTDYCQQLKHALDSRSNACLDIKCLEKNVQTHQIEINFLNISLFNQCGTIQCRI